MSAGLAATSITSTDPNEPMLDHAQLVGTAAPVVWQQADVMSLPFSDAPFDAAVCQFGVTCFPDKVAAHEEVARVPRPGGTYLNSVWDRLEANEFAHEIGQKLAALYPDNPPTFMSRTPHGYFNDATIRASLAAGAYIEGTPLRSAIEVLQRIAVHVQSERVTDRSRRVTARRHQHARRIDLHVTLRAPGDLKDLPRRRGASGSCQRRANSSVTSRIAEDTQPAAMGPSACCMATPRCCIAPW
jgi:SAM-dependent methyltransferase